MGPEHALPYDKEAFSSVDSYVDSLLDLVSSHALLRTFCGGVHVLDFFTSDPDLYTRLMPQEWRDFFAQHQVMNILDLLMREGLTTLGDTRDNDRSWRDCAAPPANLIEYIRTVRKHLLDRVPGSGQCARNRSQKKLARDITVGMNVKKVHEVGLFAAYIDKLVGEITESGSQSDAITHLVDFGSGQNYLGRALASEPYSRNIVAIETKAHNTERARIYDAAAKIVERDRVVRNKKAYRAGLVAADRSKGTEGLPTPPPEIGHLQHGAKVKSENSTMVKQGSGRIQYVEQRLESGDLKKVIESIEDQNTERNILVMSLHSCGNLVHHGLRSLILNPEVKAVAMIGCCYNLLTERLGPATYKLDELRPTAYSHPRLEREGLAYDPAGFPMSNRFCTHGGDGVRLNVTARMMAVQAPANWGERDSETFFTRHFYRALLQRIFLDRGVIGPPDARNTGEISPAGHSSGGVPILIGSLRKSCYASFVAYVRGALEKLLDDDAWGSVMKDKMQHITDNELIDYEERFGERQKDLSVTWSLMAFSAGVIEAAIVVDRWLWLKEQTQVKEAWVEPLFDYRLSPRNLVVVGIKRDL